METLQQNEIGIDFLTWINGELRKEINRQDTLDSEEQNGFVDRMKTYFVAGLSSASLIVMGILSN